MYQAAETTRPPMDGGSVQFLYLAESRLGEKHKQPVPSHAHQVADPSCAKNSMQEQQAGLDCVQKDGDTCLRYQHVPLYSPSFSLNTYLNKKFFFFNLILTDSGKYEKVRSANKLVKRCLHLLLGINNWFSIELQSGMVNASERSLYTWMPRLEYAHRRGIFWTIEQPSSSVLPLFPELKARSFILYTSNNIFELSRRNI